MLSEEEVNEINQGLAVMYSVNLVLMQGLREVYKNIDREKNPDLRMYFRSLVEDAIEFLKSQKVKIKP